MSSFIDFLPRPGALFLLLFALFLGIGQITVFALSFQENYHRRQTVLSFIHMLAGFLFFVILLECYDIVNYPQAIRTSLPDGWLSFRLPWVFYAFLEAVSAGILAFQFLEYRRYKRSTVTPDTIRQTIDLLPEGICISAPDGTVLLSNLKMNVLCQKLLGERLSDAGRLWECLEANGENQNGKRLVRMSQGEVWLFSKDPLTLNEKEYDRINAVNVTEQYRIREELREKNTHLQDIRRRMQEAAELSGEMFVKQEEYTTRAALHNELGQVLLMGRHYLEHPGSADASMVILMTKQMNCFLLGESTTPKPHSEDEISLAVRMAESIGVAVEIRGNNTLNAQNRSLLASAIRECAANTVKHAAGDRLTIILSERGRPEDAVITITNNGTPPKAPVSESGGLLALRRSIEAAGGQMVIQSLPVFTLNLFLSNK